jgi:hypothetical protein
MKRRLAETSQHDSAEPAPGQLRRDPLPLRDRVVLEGGRDQRRDRCAG